MLMEILGK